ncbi:MAG: pyridoxal phosphate-dependent aminotransferase family protein [Chlorobi bacterium]|nr:pyridoxal phosphate-dependent aminotransferase family protein [Chlorobiota bacterium]
MNDIFDKIYVKGPLTQYRDIGEGYYMFPKLTGELGPRMKFNGKEMIMWSINDYLGLGNHPEIRKADAEAAARWGFAYPMGSRPMSGHTDMHEQLERELAEFAGKEAAYLLNFGYQGNVSIIDALVNKNDVIVYDIDSHASIIDGVRLHQGKRYTFQHNDVESLETMLKRAKKITDQTGGGILVISEGVFGMRGEQGILREIVELKKKYKFRIYIDDAHGFGTLGEGGRGAHFEQDVVDEIDLYFATFAKAMASIGGFVAGDKDVIKYLQYNMRSQVYAKAMPMALVEGALKRLDMIRSHPELKDQLWDVALRLQKGLVEAGFDIGNTNTPITPVYLHVDPIEAGMLVRDMRDNHRIFTSIVVYPVIPRGMIILRMIPTTRHTQAEIDETIEAFKQIRQKQEAGVYKEMAKHIKI